MGSKKETFINVDLMELLLLKKDRKHPPITAARLSDKNNNNISKERKFCQIVSICFSLVRQTGSCEHRSVLNKQTNEHIELNLKMTTAGMWHVSVPWLRPVPAM